MQSHLLLISEDRGNELALKQASDNLTQGACVTWICSTPTSAKLDDLEAIAALKNVYIATLNLLVITREESQPFEVLTGPLDATRLALCADRLFDCTSVSQCIIATPTTLTQTVRDWVAASLPAAKVTTLALAKDTTATDASTNSSPDAVFVKVILQGRETSFSMRRTAGTLLDGADDAGIDLPFSCRGGVCSTCRAKLTEGEVLLTENYALEEWELDAGFTLPCQAEPISNKITLDYDQV